MDEERGSGSPQVMTEILLRRHRAPESPALRGPGLSPGSPEPCLLPCLLRCRDRAQVHMWSWTVNFFCFQSHWTGSRHDTKDIGHHVWLLCVEIGMWLPGSSVGMDGPVGSWPRVLGRESSHGPERMQEFVPQIACC